MARYNAANNWETELSSAIDSSQTSISVISSAGHPTVPFKVSVGDEIMNVTVVSGTTLTVQRDQEGTTNSGHGLGTKVENRFTAEVQNDLWDSADTAKNIAEVASFKNKIINGNFDIWQRDVSSFTGDFVYTADRWRQGVWGSGVAVDSERAAFTVGQTDVPYEPKYFHKTVLTGSAANNSGATLRHALESVRTFAGQTVTVSFWAKESSGDTKNMSIEFTQDFGAGGSPSAAVTAIGVEKVTLTNTWQKFTKTVAIPSITGKTLGTTHDGFLAIALWLSAGSDFNARTDSLGVQSGDFHIAQVQLEAGDVATPFEQRPIGTETSLCQRYFYQTADNLATFTGALNWGAYDGSSLVRASVSFLFPVRMRIAPTITVYSPHDGAANNIQKWPVTGSMGNIAGEATNQNERSCHVRPTNTADFATGDGFRAHLVVDAEL